MADLQLLTVTPAAAATTIAVDCTANPNALAAALNNPALSDGTTLLVSGTCVGTFEIRRSITITSSFGAELDARGAGTVVTVDPGKTVVLNLLIITGGSGTGLAPGGILNNGALTVSTCLLYRNVAKAGADNAAIGGILNNGTLTLTNGANVGGNTATVVDDPARFGLAFGGILNDGALTLSNGGTVGGNSATAPGRGNARGGIENDVGATLTMSGGWVFGNTASAGRSAVGGIINVGTASISQSRITLNNATSAAGTLGGAVGGVDDRGGGMTLTRTRVDLNRASTPAAGGVAVGGISKSSVAAIALKQSQVVNNAPINCNFSDPACAAP